MLPDHLWEQKCRVKMRQRASDPNPGLHVQPCRGLETANSAGQTLGWGVTQEGSNHTEHGGGPGTRGGGDSSRAGTGQGSLGSGYPAESLPTCVSLGMCKRELL